METITILIFAVLVALLALNVWQAISFHNHSKTSIRSTQLNDKKYYELKSHMQFVTSVFPIILSIVLYAGYNKLEQLPTQIKTDITKQLSPQIDSIRNSTQRLIIAQQALSEKYGFLDSFYRDLQAKGIGIDKNLGISSGAMLLLNKKLLGLEMQTDSIAKKDIIHQPIYVVADILYDFAGDSVDQYHEFKDLKTISGQKLPLFKKPPQIISFSNFAAEIAICDVTTTHFNTSHISSNDAPNCRSQINGKIKFGIIIFQDD